MVRISLESPTELAEMLRQVVKARFSGNASNAARVAGLAQSHFAKLLAGRLRAVTPDTVRALRVFLTRHSAFRLDSMLSAPEAYFLDRYHSLWLAHVSNCIGGDWTPLFERGAKGASLVRGGLSQRAKSQLLADLVTDWIRPPLASYFAPLEGFFKRAGPHAIPGPRRFLAVLRIAAPLLDHHESGFMERGWQELSLKEKTAFLKAGVTRELILLNRETGLARASSVAKKEFADSVFLLTACHMMGAVINARAGREARPHRVRSRSTPKRSTRRRER